MQTQIKAPPERELRSKPGDPGLFYFKNAKTAG
jgi:hypothetical protein